MKVSQSIAIKKKTAEIKGCATSQSYLDNKSFIHILCRLFMASLTDFVCTG